MELECFLNINVIFGVIVLLVFNLDNRKYFKFIK